VEPNISNSTLIEDGFFGEKQSITISLIICQTARTIKMVNEQL